MTVVGSILLSAAVLWGSEPPAPTALARVADVTAIARNEIASGRIPGAVVEIGQRDMRLYRGAVGSRATLPAPVPMTVDTLFDLASLTKVVATTTAVMQLAERGLLDLDRPASVYWERFGTHGKGSITIRDLLTHYSGLRADLDVQRPWSGYRTAMQMLVDETPLAPPGSRYLYSDENFAVLGEIVRRVSGMPVDVYSQRRIFMPLGMRHTRFRPPIEPSGVPIAPTGLRVLVSDTAAVNDPMAARMNGVAGHAGLFSTADDLARFARMLLGGGELDGMRILQPRSVAAMTTPQSPISGGRLRGLGWDLAQPLPSTTGVCLPAGSYGHTGYTGTMIWIDPESRIYMIVLTNRTYPDGRGDAQPLRDAVMRLVWPAC